MSKIPNDVQRALKDVKTARSVLEEANEALVKAYAQYLAEVEPEILAELQTLTWERPPGRGSRTNVRATVGKDVKALHLFHEVRNLIDEGTNRDVYIGNSLPCGLHVRFHRSYSYTSGDAIIVTVPAKDAEKHGVYTPPKKNARDKRRMNQLLDEAQLTPAELEEILKKRKKGK